LDNKKIAATLAAAAFALGAAGVGAQDAPGILYDDNTVPMPRPEDGPAPGGRMAPEPGPAPGRTPADAQRLAGVAQPYRAGSFLIYPELLLVGFHDSNVFYSTANRLSDQAFVFAPAVWAQSDWREHALNFNAAADLTRYDTYTTENTNDWRLNAEGRYDLGVDANVYGGVRYAREHEDRESPDARNGLKPTLYYAGRAYAGAFRQLGRWSVRVGGTALDLDYRDVEFLTQTGGIAIINNDDRDRRQYAGGLRIGYEVSPRVEPFVQAAVDYRRYRTVPDDLGYDKDSDGLRLVGGARANLPNRLKAEVYGGWMSQRYSDGRLADVSKPAFGAALQWRPIDRLRINAAIDRTVEETTVLQVTPALVPASSYVNTYFTADLGYRVTDRLTWQLAGSISRVEYQGIARDDEYYSGGTGIVLQIERRLFVDLSYLHRTLHSSLQSEDFSKNQVFLRFAWLVAP